LKSGKITVYSTVTNYVSKPPVNGTYFDNSFTALQIKQVEVEKKDSSYVYNSILSCDQTFQPDASGLEAFIVPKSSVKVTPPPGNQTLG
jgi:hypothetical protein